ncbi:hypothetical protein PROFUN_00874 [Planoprotostelium fungivorum]|uniref:Uncharacterized protein n=1 Tax=Planoprotostelium fungivorum TaxID=1890364 RepID=A0A2P6P083_9EUKA|nr:hypothetical protein PROFUN_00874 [Planoprotostelium fungivorum]
MPASQWLLTAAPSPTFTQIRRSNMSNKVAAEKKPWGVYDKPWEYKCATQLPDEEILPRLRQYLELRERRLPQFLKPIEDLTPVEQLSVVAAVNACASSIFNQCSTVRGNWERTYEPDIHSPNNEEKLKRFAELIKKYRGNSLLPLLEDLAENGREKEALGIIKMIRQLAHVNKNSRRAERLAMQGRSRKRQNSNEGLPSPKAPKTSVSPIESLFALAEKASSEDEVAIIEPIKTKESQPLSPLSASRIELPSISTVVGGGMSISSMQNGPHPLSYNGHNVWQHSSASHALPSQYELVDQINFLKQELLITRQKLQAYECMQPVYRHPMYTMTTAGVGSM